MTSFREMKQQYAENPLGILKQLVGKGIIEGNDYVALNPRRADKNIGSFRIDIATGRFHDFATGDSGGDIIDLAAFIYRCSLVETAERLQQLFPSLAGKSVTAEKIPTKKKKLDAAYIWKKSIKAQHQYLDNKKISIGNARVNIYNGRKQVVIPLTDICPTIEGNLSIKGLQFIDEDGNKGFPLPFKGLFHVASDYELSRDNIIIAEGYATARSIAQSTDFYVIAAMSACNLKTVAIKIAEQFPYSKIIIATDNDEPGRKIAEEIAQTLGNKVQIIYPTHGKNFNDMYKDCGAGSVKLIFNNNGVINE